MRSGLLGRTPRGPVRTWLTHARVDCPVPPGRARTYSARAASSARTKPAVEGLRLAADVSRPATFLGTRL